MSKLQRIFLHLACMARKSSRGLACAWHWQHVLREFGLGEYAVHRAETRYALETTRCST